MEKRKLGTTSLAFLPIAFGGNVFGWTIDEKTSFELLDQFEDHGFSFIDTADVYSRWKPGNKGGESETIIGRWMKQRNNRSKIILATKVGSDMGQGKKDLSRKHILHAVEESLSRLQTDYIDLYQTHWDDETTAIDETLEAYQTLVNAGKVRFIGASNLSPERLKSSLALSREKNFPRYASFQPLYNLYDRESFEKDLMEICVKENLGVITYYSLASGFLTGKYRSEQDLHKSARGGGMGKYLNERGLRILHCLDKISTDHHTTPASVSLAWLLTRPSVTAPIVSATNVSQLQSLFNAIQLKLDEGAIAELTKASTF
jgi:aryl-alcohol dehydrogenase-like predicted oxidoreductase